VSVRPSRLGLRVTDASPTQPHCTNCSFATSLVVRRCPDFTSTGERGDNFAEISDKGLNGLRIF
jgi:hypothetical protein